MITTTIKTANQQQLHTRQLKTSVVSRVHTAHSAAPQDHSQTQPTHPGRTQHAVGHGFILLMMSIMMPETC
jgi:hypothetical protein